MKTLLSAAIAASFIACSAAAAPVTFNFSGGSNQFNEGLPGDGPWTASVTLDDAGATQSNMTWAGAVTNVSLNINGATFQLVTPCSDINCNSVSQIQLGGGQDAFVAEYEGDFVSNRSYNAERIFFDIRTDLDLFSTATSFMDRVGTTTIIDHNSGLADPDPFGTYFRFDVNFDTVNGATDDVALVYADLSFLSVTVGPAPVPLPAGAPLLIAGLGAFAWVKRRRW